MSYGNIIINNVNNSKINIGVTNNNNNDMWKQKIKQLVAQGRVKEAIAIYVENNGEGCLSLSGRFYGNERQYVTLANIDKRDYDIEANKIVTALLSYIGEEAPYTPPPQIQQPQMASKEDLLLSIIETNKRRNEKLAASAKVFLDEYVAYKHEKLTNATYDISGRRFRDLEARTEVFLDELKETKLDDLEEIVNRIMVLVVGVPEYNDLDEAYRLAQGRGFTSEYCDRNLNNRPDDREVRISIAERLESFASTIRVK